MTAPDDRKQADLDLLRFRGGIDRSSDAIFITDLDGTIRYVNDAFTRVYGYARTEALGKTPRILKSGTLPAEVYQSFWQQLLSKQVVAGEIENRHRNGQLVPIDGSNSPILDAEGEIIGFLAIHRDIRERKATEEALMLTQFTIDHASLLILWVDPAGIVTYCNDTAVRLAGRDRDALLGRPLGELDPSFAEPHWIEHWKDLVARGSITMETCLRRPDGGEAFLETTAKHLDFRGRQLAVYLGRDISARKRAEAERDAMRDQLEQALRLELIGQLAGGVAHDFNNLTNAIIGYSEMLLEDLPADSPLRADVSAILGAGERAGALTRQLLLFSRKQVELPTRVSPNDVLKNLASMLRRLIGEYVTLDLSLADDAGEILMDASQLEQLVMNLVLNARDAMPDGGHIELRTETVCSAQAAGPLPAGDMLRIVVSDEGTGMSEDVQRRIFEPFFTTKAAGKGTGLGLSVVYGVVHQHEGTITVDSQPARGTRFEVCFPRLVERQTQDDAQKPATSDGSGEVVLLVEDDGMLRLVIQRILLRHGFRVLVAHSGRHALELVAREQPQLDLLVSDVVMPEIDGIQLYDRLVLDRPDLKVVFISGYLDDLVNREGLRQRKARLVLKPVQSETLVATLREVLDQRTT